MKADLFAPRFRRCHQLWPEVLENGLVDHWVAANYRAFELPPLRAKDIAEAARSEGINPESFFNEIRQKAVERSVSLTSDHFISKR